MTRIITTFGSEKFTPIQGGWQHTDNEEIFFGTDTAPGKAITSLAENALRPFPLIICNNSSIPA